jgi:tetratricopeptide (TPR) repeat protein
MLRSVAAIGLMLFAHAAWAADQPRYEPPPAWVKPFDIPKPTNAGDQGSTRILLEDSQDRFVADGLDIYWERAERIETPQGLANVGNLAFDWNPDTETLLIHRARIIRGDKVIDLLAQGQKFVILRRENKLEYAMLDGTLTAAIQPEGLEVGDILDIAIGYEARDPIMRGRSGRTLVMPSTTADLFAIRELWPASETPHWRETPGLDKPKISTTADGSELSISMINAVRPKAPKQAPDRYSHPGLFEISEAGSWPEVSTLMAPYYDKAALLKPDSQLRAEIAKIKAASPDPKIQAAVALRLVQDQVRYLFLGMNNGGFIPVPADVSWSRRFGDCKGKTVLLLALLRELGIEAEPALVDTKYGEDLDVRPAMVAAFDHVIVRAVVAGKTYWLDGTRSADRTLDDLQVPNFHWALPLRATGATLEKLVVPPLDKPEELTQLRIDATAGIEAPAPAHADYILRGDAAVEYKERLADMSRDDVGNYLRDYWRKEYYWIDITKVDAVYDDATGEEHVSMDGTATIPWKGGNSTMGKRYEADGAVLGWKSDHTRDPGPDQDAPFSVHYPYFVKTTETIVLPNGGNGFTIEGSEVDKTIGAWEFKRIAKVETGAFTMEASTRGVTPEFPAADAQAVAKDLREMSDFTVYLRAPTGGGTGNVDIKSPKTAEDFLARGFADDGNGDHAAAISAFTQAILLKPDLSAPYAARSAAYAANGDLGHAATDIGRAIQLAPNDPATLRAEGYLDVKKREYSQAIDMFTRAIALSPNVAYAYEMRGYAYQVTNQGDKALSDYAEVLRLTPGRGEIYSLRAEILIARNEGQAALGEADKYLAALPKEPRAHAIRGRALTVLDRNAEAVKELDLAIAAKPQVDFYLWRAQARGDDTAKMLADIDKTLALDPHYLKAYLLRSSIYLAMKKVDQGIKALDDAAKVMPDNLNIVRSRRAILEDNHRYDRAVADIDRLLAAAPADTELLVDRCRDRALSDQKLDMALADCQKAIGINADIDESFQWRALIYFRMGRLDDALADYDLFLKHRPNSPVGHFGRGIVQLRKRQTEDGQRELAVARKANPNIDAQFAGFPRAAGWYGLTEQAMVSKTVVLGPTTVNEFVSRGNGLINHGEYRAAIGDFDHALGIDPKSALAFANRGIAHYWLGEYDPAKADFDKAAELSPLEPVTFRGHGLLALRNGDNKGAVEAFGQSIQYDPENAFGYDYRARAYENLRDSEKALADLDAVLRLEPSRAGIYGRRSNLYALTRQGEKALADADRAVAANPKDAIAHFARARALKLLDRRDEAQAEYDRSIELQPLVATYLERAQLNYRKPDRALADINSALSMDPKSVEAYLVRANFYKLAGNLKQALADAEQGMALAPDDRQAKMFHVGLLAQDHQYARALQESDLLIAQAPSDATLLNSRCWLRATWGQQLESALSDCNASLSLTSAPGTLDSRGLVYLRLGRLDDALSDYDAAIKARPKVAGSWFARGLVKLRKGSNEDGQTDLAAARAIDPKVDVEYAGYGLMP